MSKALAGFGFGRNPSVVGKLALAGWIALAVVACEEAVWQPKPRGYPRVMYPEKTYQDFSERYCGFTFAYPGYARIEQDTTFFDERPTHPCWFNIVVPAFHCQIHCSYVPVTAGTPVVKLKGDAFKMTDWHNKKATYISETPFYSSERGTKGMFFEVEGPVASKYQFFITDTAEQRHFFRGALYFETAVQPDSLAPIYAFMKQDLERLLETFQWE
jgi:gliding motility-associated lipoprotein GldD